MEGSAATGDGVGAGRSVPSWVLGLVPLLLIVAALGTFAALGGPGLASAAARRSRSSPSSARS
jgi:hypothetical protein